MTSSTGFRGKVRLWALLAYAHYLMLSSTCLIAVGRILLKIANRIDPDARREGRRRGSEDHPKNG